eukprot:SAG31_NODE_13959_length_834_cov_203.231293_1_plen_121_part_00
MVPAATSLINCSWNSAKQFFALLTSFLSAASGAFFSRRAIAASSARAARSAPEPGAAGTSGGGGTVVAGWCARVGSVALGAVCKFGAAGRRCEGAAPVVDGGEAADAGAAAAGRGMDAQL